MIKVAIVDDKRDIRNGLKIVVDNAEGFECTGLFEDGRTAIEGLKHIHADVVLMDIEMPGISGIECVKQLKKEQPNLDIIMLTVYDDDEHIFQSLRAGACGYLTKNVFPSKLLQAIKEVRNGGAPMSPFIARRVISSFNDLKKPVQNLSKRESDVLNLLCEGKTYKEIAKNLFVSTNTVRFHLKNIYKKLQVNSKMEAVIKAKRMWFL